MLVSGIEQPMDLFYRILRPLLCPAGVLLGCGSASKMGFSTTMAAVCTTRPVIVGIPKGRRGVVPFFGQISCWDKWTCLGSTQKTGKSYV